MKDTLYFAPKDVEETLGLLTQYPENVTILAGGTDLVPKINYYQLKPDILLYIGGLDLSYVRENDGKLMIGAGVSWADLISNPLVRHKAHVLTDAGRLGGTVATRNIATIGGNLANASPAADLATPLLAIDAEILLKSPREERVVAAKDFFTGPGETVLKKDELIMEIRIPHFSQSSTVFLKLGRRKAMTLSVVNVAVRLELANTKGNATTCADLRIAVGSAAPAPMRCTKAEEMLRGNIIDQTAIRECAARAMEETNPIDDQRATAWYRKKAGLALVRRALAQAAGIEIN